jgi:hypothetical protein
MMFILSHEIISSLLLSSSDMSNLFTMPHFEKVLDRKLVN